MRYVVAALLLLAVPARADEASLDPGLVQRAVAARATGQLIDVERADDLAGCRDLGSDAARSPDEGLVGRARVRVALRKIARARGASHVQYFDYAAGPPQAERGRFFDCTGDAAPVAPVAPVAAPGCAAPPPPPPRVNSGLVSLQAEVLPAGRLLSVFDGVAGTTEQSVDLTTSVGITPVIEFFPARSIALGLAPRVVIGMKPDDTTVESAYEVDLRGRARFGELDGAGLSFSGYLTLGGSWIVFPGDIGTSSGAVLGFGGMASYALQGHTFVIFDVGYQVGGQRLSSDGTTVSLSTQLFHVGVGFGSYL